jgi:hypothetical protein
MIAKYDLCIAWNWEYDADFVTLLDTLCRARELSLLQITPEHLDDALHSLTEQQVSFYAFFDRASEGDPNFMPLARWVCEHDIYCINSYERASRSWDKAALHWAFVKAGLDVPHTIILPAFEEQPILSMVDLAPLGEQFTIKPVYGSGGEGVLNKVTTWDQVLSVRQENSADRYLLQADVVPRELDTRLAWFRVIYCAQQIYPCWWDPHTHVYTPVTSAEKHRHSLDPLFDTAIAIAKICRLDLFSSEIAFTPKGRFVIVDYVNDQIDLRLQSKTLEGVPDDIVQDIAERLVNQVAMHCQSSFNS